MSTSEAFVITGTSDLFSGVHALNIHGGLHPVGGKSYGRISPEGVAAMRRFFKSEAEAQAEIDRLHARAAEHHTTSAWTFTVQPAAAVA